VSPFTTPSLRLCSAATSICGSATWMPWSFALWRICSNSSELSSSALLGMQPMRRQVPPSAGSFSMHAVLNPSCAARIAAT